MIIQKPECGPKAAQPSLGEPDTASVPNGSHAEADSAPEQPEEVDEATAVKRQVLIKAAPLAGGWGLERFGFADITVLKLLEALPGQPTDCTKHLSLYPLFVESSECQHLMECVSSSIQSA